MAYLSQAPTQVYNSETLKTAAQIAAEKQREEALKKGASYHQSAVDAFKFDNMLAQATQFIGNIGIAAWQFFSGKKDTRREASKKRKAEQTKSDVTNILNKIYNTGMSLVEQGVDPNTDQFEQALSALLFDDVGYRGNCNATVWVPGSSKGPGRPVWFKADNGGRTVTIVTGRGSAPNLQSYWYSECASAKTDWMRHHQNILIATTRDRQLNLIQAKQGKASLLIGGGVLGVAGILGAIIVINIVRGK